MTRPRPFAFRLACAASVAIALTATGKGQTHIAPRDLEGVWGFATLTPLERPSEFGGKAFVTDEEADAWVEQTLERGNRDRRDGGAAVDVGRAVNDYWFERGTSLSRYDGKALTSMFRS